MLVALDTNVPLDLAQGVGDVVDAIDVIGRRIPAARLILPPTVGLELAYLTEFADEEEIRAAAQRALRLAASKGGVELVNFVPVGHGVIEALGANIRQRGLLPNEEMHDALILAESALLGCSILLTSDAHLRAVDHASLSWLLRPSHAAAPLIATPREIVRKFFR